MKHVRTAAMIAAATILVLTPAAAQQSPTPSHPTATVAPGTAIKAPVRPRPDLLFRGAYVAAVQGGPPVTSIRQGRPYWVCHTVLNLGAAPSGPFRVTGDALAVPVAPYQDHAGLAVNQCSLNKCLAYRTTPRALGRHRINLYADSLHAVSETNENNNGKTVWLTVVP